MISYQKYHTYHTFSSDFDNPKVNDCFQYSFLCHVGVKKNVLQTFHILWLNQFTLLPCFMVVKIRRKSMIGVVFLIQNLLY